MATKKKQEDMAIRDKVMAMRKEKAERERLAKEAKENPQKAKSVLIPPTSVVLPKADLVLENQIKLQNYIQESDAIVEVIDELDEENEYYTEVDDEEEESEN